MSALWREAKAAGLPLMWCHEPQQREIPPEITEYLSHLRCTNAVCNIHTGYSGESTTCYLPIDKVDRHILGDTQPEFRSLKCRQLHQLRDMNVHVLTLKSSLFTSGKSMAMGLGSRPMALGSYYNIFLLTRNLLVDHLDDRYENIGILNATCANLALTGALRYEVNFETLLSQAAWSNTDKFPGATYDKYVGCTINLFTSGYFTVMGTSDIDYAIEVLGKAIQTLRAHLRIDRPVIISATSAAEINKHIEESITT